MHPPQYVCTVLYHFSVNTFNMNNKHIRTYIDNHCTKDLVTPLCAHEMDQVRTQVVLSQMSDSKCFGQTNY